VKLLKEDIMFRRLTLPFVLLLMLLTGCGGNGPANTVIQPGSPVLPDYMRQGYETYHETGGIPRPNNAVDVFIVYSPESQTYMPRIIESFNRLSAAGTNPVTGQPWGQGERPIYVAGQDPTTGSSGTAAQGITNAFLAPGNENVYHPTIFQPSVGHWLALVNYNTGREVFDLANATPTALSPIVIAMWESRLEAIQTRIGRQEIGWQDLIDVLESPGGWCDYGLADCRRAVYYGHTDPRHSSTGLSTTIAEFYACARQNGFTERILSQAAVDDPAVQECVRQIETLVKHYSRRAEDFLSYISRGPDYLDFLALEETDLICLNRGAQQGDQTCTQPQERLIAIYPTEGTFWHEHPFGIVQADWVSAEQSQAARLFTQFVLTAEMQRQIVGEGFRPANSSVSLEYPFVPENGVDPAEPTTVLDAPAPEVIVGIQESWSLVKKRADIIVLIDTSGSMNDEGKIDQARAAALAFLSEMDSTNNVGLTTFDDGVQERVRLNQLEAVRADLTTEIQNLRADGGTALFDGLLEVLTEINAQPDTNRIRAIVLLSDGADTASDNQLNQVLDAIKTSRGDVNPVIVIPVAYGSNADVEVLNSIARASSTTVQSGDPNNITGVLQIIGSYF
jgi:Ca-activated chloride channel homolog